MARFLNVLKVFLNVLVVLSLLAQDFGEYSCTSFSNPMRYFFLFFFFCKIAQVQSGCIDNV